MNDNLQDLLKSAEQLTYLVRHHCEVAEAKVAELNARVAASTKSGQIRDLCLLGPMLFECEHQGGGGENRVGQAALLGDWGVGICWWSADAYRSAQQSDELTSLAAISFVPFDACAPLIKALLVPYLSGLLNELQAQLKN